MIFFALLLWVAIFVISTLALSFPIFVPHSCLTWQDKAFERLERICENAHAEKDVAKSESSLGKHIFRSLVLSCGPLWYECCHQMLLRGRAKCP